MSEPLDLDFFKPHVGTTFRVQKIAGLEDGYPIELASAEPDTPAEGAPRQDPFTLVFTGDAAAYMPQGVYDLEHDELGQVTLFLVPLGPEAPGRPMRYEALFN